METKVLDIIMISSMTTMEIIIIKRSEVVVRIIMESIKGRIKMVVMRNTTKKKWLNRLL